MEIWKKMWVGVFSWTQCIYRWKVHLVGYNSVADNTVYLHSFSCYCLRNTRNVAKFQENMTLQQFKVIDLGVNGKPYVTSY